MKRRKKDLIVIHTSITLTLLYVAVPRFSDFDGGAPWRKIYLNFSDPIWTKLR